MSNPLVCQLCRCIDLRQAPMLAKAYRWAKKRTRFTSVELAKALRISGSGAVNLCTKGARLGLFPVWSPSFQKRNKEYAANHGARVYVGE